MSPSRTEIFFFFLSFFLSSFLSIVRIHRNYNNFYETYVLDFEMSIFYININSTGHVKTGSTYTKYGYLRLLFSRELYNSDKVNGNDSLFNRVSNP